MTTTRVELVTTPDDPRVADYVDLTDVELRRRKEPAEGLFMAEGEKVIRRALEAGYPLRSLLLEERWLPGLAGRRGRHGRAGLCRDPRRPGPPHRVRRAPRSAGRDVAPTAAGGRGPAGARRRVSRSSRTSTTTPTSARPSGRLPALGLDAVLLSPRCADPLYRRSVRVSMGAALAMPWTRLDRWPAGLDAVRDAGLHRARADPGRRRHAARRGARRRCSRAAPSCSAPRGRGSPTARSRGPMSGCASRWLAGWTRSTSALPPPSRSTQ